MDSRAGQRTDWGKFFSRHFSGCTKSEILERDWRDEDRRAIEKAVEKRFAPFLYGEHLYQIDPKTAREVCIGYVDATEDGYFMISLASDFGEDCEVCFGQKNACERLFELYQQATA